jgi:hypothetical protein
MYQAIRQSAADFDLIFSYDESLCALDPRVRFYPYGTTWIPEQSRRIYRKERLASMVASAKSETEGHRLRHEAAARRIPQLDLFGRAYRNVADKTEALAPYRYSVAIENSRLDTYFTEKIIDCFLTGTIPLYWGTARIGSHFDRNGIISFSSIEELSEILNSISVEDYGRRMPAIERNFNTAQRYLCLEDQIWERGLREITLGSVKKR